MPLTPLVLAAVAGLATPASAVVNRVSVPRPAPVVAPADTVDDLRDVFAVDALLSNLNRDPWPDAVAARLVLAPDPGTAEIAAAANVAARLGYETTATDLGRAATVGETFDAPIVLIGDEPAASTGLDVAALRAGMAPGQGAVVHVGPSAAYRRGGLALVGYDASGLLEASAYLAGRHPSVWGVDGTSWGAVVEGVDSLAAGADGAELRRIVVDGRRPGVARARVRVRVPDATAREALLGRLAAPAPDSGAHPLADLHVRDLHRLDVLVAGGGGADTTIVVRPPEPWSTTEGGTYRPPADAPFSLADLYT
ncbi:MAG: hypothetical protein KJO11_03695, partial [Gemmatimonadetes bacterium]|nr:hypothetical protein [Gemmatimonadota bacterium]